MKSRILALGLVVGAVLVGTGCGRPAAPRPAAPAAMPFALERVAEAWEGTAQEVLEAGGYTYVAVAVAADDVRWAVGLAKPVARGTRVRVRSFGMKRDFESHRLGRVFPELRFGVITVVDVTRRKST